MVMEEIDIGCYVIIQCITQFAESNWRIVQHIYKLYVGGKDMYNAIMY